MVAGDLNAMLKERLSAQNHLEKHAGNTPEVDVLRVGDTTLDTSTPVGLGAELTIVGRDEGIIMPASWDFCSTEAGTNLEGLGGRDREHGVAKFGLELIEDGLTKTSGNLADHARNGATDGILSILGTDDALRAE